MALEVVSLVLKVFLYVVDLFSQILDAVGLKLYYFAMFGVLIALVYLFSPVTAGVSDVSNKTNRRSDK